MDNYKDMEKYATLLNSKEWVKTIDELKELECDNTKKDYYVIYRKDNYRKDRNFQFHVAQFIDETKSFIFTRYKENANKPLIDEVASRETIKMIDIISIEIKDKPDWSKLIDDFKEINNFN